MLWVKQFILFHRKRYPLEMGEAEIYTHVLQRGPLGVRSPADLL
jgi:hypothetical protein